MTKKKRHSNKFIRDQTAEMVAFDKLMSLSAVSDPKTLLHELEELVLHDKFVSLLLSKSAIEMIKERPTDFNKIIAQYYSKYIQTKLIGDYPEKFEIRGVQ
jgi:hypothetical protein